MPNNNADNTLTEYALKNINTEINDLSVSLNDLVDAATERMPTVYERRKFALLQSASVIYASYDLENYVKLKSEPERVRSAVLTASSILDGVEKLLDEKFDREP